MADIFDQIASQTPSKGDIFDQISSGTRTPADSTDEMKQAQWNQKVSQNPVTAAANPEVWKNIGNQAIVNPIVQTANAFAPALRGLDKDIGGSGGGQNIQGPDMSQAPMAAKVLGDVASGAGYGAGASIMGGGNPMIGMGAMGALSAQGNNQNPVFGAVEGVGQGAVQGLVGLAGSKLVQGIAKPLSSSISADAAKWITKYAPNVGTALGMGTAGAIMAPSGQWVEGAATGATFGAMSPMAGPKFITSDEYNNKYLPEAGDKFVNVLNPGKNVYKNFNNSGNDVDEAAQTLAHNRIIIDQTADGKIDTTNGQQQLLDATKPYAQQLQQMLATNKSTMPAQGGFDLEDLRKQAYDAIPNHPDFQDAVSRQAARNQVDKFIDAEIAEPERGRYVNGQTLDDIKGGWWKVRYDQNNAAAKPVGGLLGGIAKTQLENAYPNQPIQQTNAAQGKLLNAYHLLDMTNGNVVKGGKLGNHMAAGAGAIIGVGAGHLIPIPGVGEMVGGGAGLVAGEAASKFINDPTRITTGIAKGLDNLKIVNPSGMGESASKRPGVVTPDLMNQRNIPTPQDLGISMNPIAGALGYDRVGAYGASRMAQEQPGMTTPVFRTSGMPINQPPNPGALGLGQSGQGMPNERPQVLPNVHDVIPMRGASQSAVNPMNINPKTAAANGPLQPNLRAQSSSFAKAGTPEVLPESQSGSTLGSRPQTPLSGVSDEQLQNIKNIADAEKILRRGKKK